MLDEQIKYFPKENFNFLKNFFWWGGKKLNFSSPDFSN